jgi:hypothetical protein
MSSIKVPSNVETEAFRQCGIGLAQLPRPALADSNGADHLLTKLVVNVQCVFLAIANQSFPPRKNLLQCLAERTLGKNGQSGSLPLFFVLESKATMTSLKKPLVRLAVAIHADLAARRTNETLIELPVETWDRCTELVRQIRRAQLRGRCKPNAFGIPFSIDASRSRREHGERQQVSARRWLARPRDCPAGAPHWTQRHRFCRTLNWSPFNLPYADLVWYRPQTEV